MSSLSYEQKEELVEDVANGHTAGILSRANLMAGRVEDDLEYEWLIELLTKISNGEDQDDHDHTLRDRLWECGYDRYGDSVLIQLEKELDIIRQSQTLCGPPEMGNGGKSDDEEDVRYAEDYYYGNYYGDASDNDSDHEHESQKRRVSSGEDDGVYPDYNNGAWNEES